MQIKIEDINSASIEKLATELGIDELEFIGKYYHPDFPDSEDHSIKIYEFPAGFRVGQTNGEPIWEENDLQEWAEMLEIYHID